MGAFSGLRLISIVARTIDHLIASSRGVVRKSWGARDRPSHFCKPFLSRQPTTGGENDYCPTKTLYLVDYSLTKHSGSRSHC